MKEVKVMFRKDLHSRCKAMAALEGVPLKFWVAEKLEKEVKELL